MTAAAPKHSASASTTNRRSDAIDSNGHLGLLFSIVNFGDPTATLRCVKSIIRSAEFVPQLDPFIVVVDNSTDPSCKQALVDGLAPLGFQHQTDDCRAEALWHRQLIVSARNRGYGGGQNVSLRRARTAADIDWVLIANSDIVVSAASLKNLYRVLLRTEQSTLVGVTVESSSGSVEAYGGGRIRRWTGRPQLCRTSTEPIEYLHGAAFCVSAEALDHDLQFDERFFLFFEDVDFCRQAVERGLVLSVAGEVRIVHMGGESTGSPQGISQKSVTGAYHVARSMVLFYRKHHLWHFLPIAAAARMALATLYLRGERRYVAGAVLAGLGDGFRCSLRDPDAPLRERAFP